MRSVAVLALSLLVLAPIFVSAATFENPLLISYIRNILRGFVLAVIYVGTPALAAFIVWTGFLFVASQGNEQGLRKAKGMALDVLIGGFFLLALWVLVQIAGNTLAGLSSASLLVVIAAFLLYVRYKSG